MTEGNDKKLQELRKQFEAEVDAIHLTYYEIGWALKDLHSKIPGMQAQVAENTPSIGAVEELEDKPFCFGKGHPGDPGWVELVCTTQGELKQDILPDGRAQSHVGQMCLVKIYEIWDGHYRKRIAEIVGVKTNRILSDLMGDLRLLRHDIVHHKGIATESPGKCKILQWFNNGEEILLTGERYDQLLLEIRKMQITVSEQE